MKIWLILLNFLLAGGVVYQAAGFFRGGTSEVQYVAGKDRSAKNGKPAAVKPAAPKTAQLGGSEAAQILLANNIFNVARCPEALNSRWGGGSAQMALLGIYRVGNFEGAIIQQKRNRRGGPPRRTANNRNGTAQQVTEPPLKQFLRLGEALENGYVLSSIGSDSVTLSRGGGKLELQLETASKNLPSTVAAAAAAARRNRPNAQQMQQFMMMRQMRVMEQLIRQNSQQNQNNNRSAAPGRGNNRNNR